MRIAILGGTGAMGRGLAAALSAKHEVCVGSRSRDRAESVAAGVSGVRGDTNEGAARWCQVAVVSIPFRAVNTLKELATELTGKLVVSVINPLRVEDGVLQYGAGGKSAAERVASALPMSEVATAFNNVPPSFFKNPGGRHVDVLIAADTKGTFDKAAAVVQSIPMFRALYVGPLSQAESVERLTVLVLNAAKLNRLAKFSVKFVS